MKKQNYPTLTNYLAKTKKNADLYRLYNPQFSVFGKPVSEEQDFYFCYFSRHMITERNILTLFSIHTFLSYNVSKKETIKSFVHFLKKSNHDFCFFYFFFTYFWLFNIRQPASKKRNITKSAVENHQK